MYALDFAGSFHHERVSSNHQEPVSARSPATQFPTPVSGRLSARPAQPCTIGSPICRVLPITCDPHPPLRAPAPPLGASTTEPSLRYLVLILGLHRPGSLPLLIGHRCRCPPGRPVLFWKGHHALAPEMAVDLCVLPKHLHIAYYGIPCTRLIIPPIPYIQ